MKLHEALGKVNQHLTAKGIDVNNVTDEQWNSAVNELGLQSVFQNSTTTASTAPQTAPVTPATSQDLGAVIAEALKTGLAPINEKIAALDNDRVEREKREKESQKSQLEKDKQDLVDKLFKEKRISKEQKEKEYAELVKDENFSINHLKMMTSAFPVNEAFKVAGDENNDDVQEVKTGKFDPSKDWGKQSSELSEAAMQEIQSEIN